MKKLSVLIMFCLMVSCIALTGCDSGSSDNENSERDSDFIHGSFSVGVNKRVYFVRSNVYWWLTAMPFEDKQYNFRPGENGHMDYSHVTHFYWTKNEDLSWKETYSETGTSADDKFFIPPDSDVWSSLSNDEWKYLFSSRNNAANLQGNATVCGVHGYLILCDGFHLPDGCSFISGHGSGWNTNVYATEEEWTKIEKAGAVFLPAAGFRNGADVSLVGEKGYYWTGTPDGADEAYGFYFDENGITMDFVEFRHMAFALRLVVAAQ